MRARDVMTTPAVTVGPDTSAKQAAAILAERGFTALPVVDAHDDLVGVVTEADLMRDRIAPDPRFLRGGAEAPRITLPERVGEVMRTSVVTATLGTDVSELARTMLDQHLRSIPVVEGRRVVGVITRADLLRIIARDDRVIAADVRRRLTVYGGPRPWGVTVRDGVVTIVDDFGADVERHVAVVLAQAVPGVQQVRTVPPEAATSRG